MSLAIYVCGVFAVIAVMLSSYFLGERSSNPRKNTPYESGVLATGSNRVPFFTQYFLVAILFVIFDMETVFIYLWASSAKSLGTLAFLEMTVFIGALILSLAYVIRLGVLKGPSRSAAIKERQS